METEEINDKMCYIFYSVVVKDGDITQKRIFREDLSFKTPEQCAELVSSAVKIILTKYAVEWMAVNSFPNIPDIKFNSVYNDVYNLSQQMSKILQVKEEANKPTNE